jgi:hypothetical protein
MTRRGRPGPGSLRALSGILVVAGVLGAARPASALSVTAPTSMSFTAVSTTAAGTTISAQLGSVTAADSGILGILLGSFTASVSTTTFTTGGGSSWETIPKTSIAYWSGTATSSQGSCTPGQANAGAAVVLSATRTAFSCSGLLNVSATWNPTILVTLPTPLIAGTWTATITHSVA